MRRVIVALALLLLGSLAAPAIAAPSSQLAKARAEFDRGNYKRVIEKLEPELYPRALIRDEEELKEAYYLLGVSFFYDKQPERSRDAFRALLYLDPARSLDPATESPEVYAFFEGLKGELRIRLEEMRKQKQKEEDAKRMPSREVLIERVVHEAGSPWTNFMPFGYAQFRNGEPSKGVFFLTSQALLGGTSLTLFTYQALTYGIPARYNPDTDADTLRTMQIVQVATGAGFLVAYVWSVIDGFANQKQRVETKRSERPIPRETSKLEILPFVPGAPDFVGASAVWRF